MSQIINVTDAEFDAVVLKSSKPVLVDFWASYCVPCKAIAPLLEEIAEEESDRITIAKVDVGANPGAASKYNVRSIPALLLFKNGELLDTKIGGGIKKAQLLEFINSKI